MTDPAAGRRRTQLEQSVIECAPSTSIGRATGEAEEVLFVLEGNGDLALAGNRYGLEPESGAYLAPGEEYELHNPGPGPMRVVSVRIDDPVVSGEGTAVERAVVRRLADQEEQSATTSRTFRIVADPSTGLQSATHFVGYVPTERAPDHFHTYDEVIYVLEGEGTLHAGGDRTPVAAGSFLELPAADRALRGEHRRGRHATRRSVSAGRLAGGRVLPRRHPGIPGDAAGHDRVTNVVKDPRGGVRAPMKVRISLVAMALTALVAAGCGSSKSSSTTSSASSASSTTAAASSGSSKSCTASIAIEGPFTGPVAQVGLEQLHFAQLAVADDNAANHTNVTLAQDDTQLTPSLAVSKTQSIIASNAVAAIGPAGSQEVEAVGPLFGKAGMAFISGSATLPALATSGKNPTFFRVVPDDNVQGPQDANYIDQPPPPEGRADHRRRRGLLAGSGQRDGSDPEEGRDHGQSPDAQRDRHRRDAGERRSSRS